MKIFESIALVIFVIGILQVSILFFVWIPQEILNNFISKTADAKIYEECFTEHLPEIQQASSTGFSPRGFCGNSPYLNLIN